MNTVKKEEQWQCFFIIYNTHEYSERLLHKDHPWINQPHCMALRKGINPLLLWSCKERSHYFYQAAFRGYCFNLNTCNYSVGRSGGLKHENTVYPPERAFQIVCHAHFFRGQSGHVGPIWCCRHICLEIGSSIPKWWSIQTKPRKVLFGILLNSA